MKKQWEKPSLRVIVRNRPEETVLAACKALNISGPGAPAQDICMVDGFPCSDPGIS